MIVEVRFMPPTQKPTEGDVKSSTEVALFEALQKIAPQLAFPKMEGAPILKLPQPPPAPDPRNE
jgi:hypothetical protein